MSVAFQFPTSKNPLTDNDIEIYLHDLAREFNSNRMRIVANRFSELVKERREMLQEYPGFGSK